VNINYSQGRIGRVFILRLEDGEKLPASIEDFARRHRVKRGLCFLLGGLRSGGHLVVGPKDEKVRPVEPLFWELFGVHEVVAVGTIFPGQDKQPHLHLHGSAGREGRSHTGCFRPGVEVWQVGEVVILEIIGSRASRFRDESTGFELLKA